MPINELLSTFSRRRRPAVRRDNPSGSASELSDPKAEASPAEARLQNALQETKRLELALQGVRHTAGNHLALLSAILARQARETGDPQVRNELEVARSRIGAIAEAMRSVGAPPDGDLVQAKTLFERVVSGLSDFASNAGVTIELGVEDLMVNGDDGVSLMLILNELVVNSLRHAFPDDIGGTIRISFGLAAASVDSSVVLVVEDDGIGVGPPTTPPGLGRTLIQAAAETLGATLVQESRQANCVRCGSRTSITKPCVD